MSFPQSPAIVIATRSGVVYGRVDCANAAEAEHTAILLRDRISPDASIRSTQQNVFEIVLPPLPPTAF